MPRFDSHPVIVTGAASGIGRAIAERLAADGAWVAIFDRSGAAGTALELSLTTTP